MNSLYQSLGISKQSSHQKPDRQMNYLEQSNQFLVLIKQICEDHPCMSSRVMHRLIAHIHMGRDRFETFCFEHGFKVAIRRAYHRTTNPWGGRRFDNLLIGHKVSGVGQVWVSDITYYRIGDKFYCLTFILDLFSRFILLLAIRYQRIY